MEIRYTLGERSRRWSALPIRAPMGKTSWKTFIFSEKYSRAYLLPLQAAVCRKEEI
ncbi:MAG: DUF1905 domain-containing protein [Candidatus Magasanikbacteria bacterium CG10_big_fil_rev_8_21_14_0_10_47_10]|uniref:DUF1905 domain-containing protein n=1 Tax=Candidatus Magasanikbacteria bacterium CG10_big_fil_rev_8_21_14_0_10_47_10 TaxID=1974652 RepID=A0A2H0TTN6_9BACT|nr:MAG: DUF1905 domain-containing protein [Candidatus Magasanikbacteria bacterium CG10_big_fil_rev_8_21_14_0_10_47_10]